MSDIAIRVENLSKQYRIGTGRAPYKTLRESLTHALASPLRRLWRRELENRQTGEPAPFPVSPMPRGSVSQENDIIWALKDVSFSVKHGEVLGIIGRNGAGKSTLLKILSRITKPTTGRAEIHGRVGSLLEVGTGFHPELTGRENIYLNGAILGMRKAEIDRKFDQMVAFAEVEKFIDTPVKHYSSGMYVRLAFAVAAHLEPEILLVDEVLAVGDASFQKKCLGRMGDVAKEGWTVLFVSHNLAAVNRLCHRGVWLDQGRLEMTGPVENVVAAYLSSGSDVRGECRWESLERAPGNEQIRLRAVRVVNPHGEVSAAVDVRFPFYVEIQYTVLYSLSGIRVGFWLLTSDGVVIFAAGDNEDRSWEGKRREPGEYVSACEIPGNLLKSGTHILTVGADIPGVGTLFLDQAVLSFQVEQTATTGAMIHGSERLPGIISPNLQWRISKLS